MVWKLRDLMTEAASGKAERVTYDVIHDETGIGTSTLSRMAKQKTTRIDAETVERLLAFFQQRISRQLNTHDLICWEMERQ